MDPATEFGTPGVVQHPPLADQITFTQHLIQSATDATALALLCGIEHSLQRRDVLHNALMKACGDDEQKVADYIASAEGA